MPLFVLPWRGDTRAMRLALLPTVCLGCVGLYLASWTLVFAAPCLALQSLLAWAIDKARIRRVMLLAVAGTWVAVVAVATSSLGWGSVSRLWIAAIPALATLTGFVVLALANGDPHATPVRAASGGSLKSSPKARQAA